MPDILKEVAQVREQIEKVRATRHSLEGQRTALLDQLKREFNVDTIEAAEALLATLRTDLTRQEGELKTSEYELQQTMQSVQEALRAASTVINI